MKKRAVLISIIGVLFIILPLENLKGADKKEYKKFRVELYGGFALADPSDLNQRTVYDNQYITYTRSYKFSHLNAQYTNFRYSGDVGGKLKELSSAYPLGVRLRYNVSRSIAFSLGFQYTFKDCVSTLDSNYGVYWINPIGLSYFQEFTDNYSYSDYTFSVRGYSPMLGIHFMTRRNATVYLEVFVAGGPLFAECSHSTDILRRVIYTDGYWYGYDHFREMKGKGTGLALEVSGRINFSIKNHFEIFLEGGYAYQTVKKISGSYTDEFLEKDSNAVANKVITSWEGDWQMAQGGYGQRWGSFTDVYPMVSWGDGFVSAGDFSLDLSGMRFKVGIAYTF